MTRDERQRAKRDQRRDNPPNIVLTDNDRTVIEAIYQCRVLRQDQLARLCYQNANYAQRRLRLLYDHGFLDRQFLPVRGGIMNSPVLYVLDERGKNTLIEDCGYQEVRWNTSHNDVSTDFLEHALAINEFRVRLTVACQKHPDYELVTWQGESDLKADYDYVTIVNQRGRRQKVSVIPDSYFAIKVPTGKVHFFLELDRGTMQLNRFQNKILAYLEYYRSGQSEKRFGIQRFRVLTVVTAGQQRVDNLKAITEAAGGESRFWFAALEDLSAENVLNDPVWSVANREPMVSLLK